ncbi:hypothetical protein RJ639_034462 [Escallonia herrerae]|uniref:Surfeit locus protein 6 n=1 Tax=Escallonia herrerae TaxID=1293975 RepID=A0AA89BA43_9ASTE|nr:hypothetical protein RJ639_034462 [Escallonia herrerae]
MKKKKKHSHQTADAAAAPPPTTATTSDDLRTLIHSHAAFFDRLVELIPAKFYLDSSDSKPYFQGLSKAAKASAKLQTKQNLKLARRQRLDPDKSQSSTLDLLKRNIKKENTNGSENDDIDDADISTKPITDLDGDKKSVTYEELQQRLHSKLEALRANRGQGKRSMVEKRDNYVKKRKRSDDFGGGSRGGNLGKSEGEIEKDAAEAAKGLEFGRVRLNDGIGGVGKKRRKGGKAVELERARVLQEAKSNPAVAKKESWKAAVSRAAGVKVHDDPRILKESIKKERKRHEKNASKWKERVESREKVKVEKQQKRAGNIADRAEQKKVRKIAKREKKLMRPGFEGRKEGYINEGSDVVSYLTCAQLNMQHIFCFLLSLHFAQMASHSRGPRRFRANEDKPVTDYAADQHQ